MEEFGDAVTKLLDDDPDVQEEAMVKMVDAAVRHPDQWEIPEFPKALKLIVRTLLLDESPTLQWIACWAVGNLAQAHTPGNKEKMAKFPHLLRALVRLLIPGRDDHQAPETRVEAVRALRNLACARENNFAVSAFPDALPALLQLLFDDSDPGVQIQATMAVLNLIVSAASRREAAQSDMGDPPDALDCVVDLWFPDAAPRERVQALSAIVDLVAGTVKDMELVAKFPDQLMRLVGTLQAEGSQPPLKQKKSAAESDRLKDVVYVD